MTSLYQSIVFVNHLDKLSNLKWNRLNLLELFSGSYRLSLKRLLFRLDEILLQLQKLQLFFQGLHFHIQIILITSLKLHYKLGFINDQEN